jgi:flagellar motor switch protein FliN/FliY
MSDTNGSNDGMTDEEREMMKMLDQDQQGTTETPPAPAKTVEVHPVDIDNLKETPRATPDTDGNLKLIMVIPVEIKVEVGNSRLTIREVLNLAPGSIIELDRTAGSPADLIVNGTAVGQGDVVVVDESYGIRITKLVKPEDRINSL